MPSRKPPKPPIPSASVPWLEDPDEPDRMTREEMDRMIEGVAKAFPELVKKPEPPSK